MFEHTYFIVLLIERNMLIINIFVQSAVNLAEDRFSHELKFIALLMLACIMQYQEKTTNISKK